MTNSMLIPRYPGAKSSRDKYPVWDGSTYDHAIVPFAGSGRWCIPALQRGHIRSLIVADADPAVRAVWEEFAGMPYEGKRTRLDGTVSQVIGNAIDSIEGSDDIRNFGIHSLFDSSCDVINGDAPDLGRQYYAAAKILLHKLCFGGNVRSNSQGKLNISLRSDWAKAIHEWYYELPWYPPARPVIIHADWSECFQDPTTGKTIAFIDPPYHAPGNGPRVKGGMSKAYAVHGGNPNENSVLEMFKGAVRAAVDAGCDRIVATNYWGHMLVTVEYDFEGAPNVYPERWTEYGETVRFMQSLGFEWFHDLGPLQSMNNRDFNSAKAGTTEQRTVRHEGWWELGGNRQHGRVKQMSLLEVAA